ncbi:MAG: polyprenyl synthetase family protein [Jiangellales bacterium]
MTGAFDVEDLRIRVQAVLDDVLAHQADVLHAVSPDLDPLVEAAGDLNRGGKRLRPAFCYWGWRGAGGPADGPDGAAIVRAASALELFQAAALIHDDVMDDSDTRRGMPAIHRRFADLHRGESWRGEPERFGQAAAILLGDLCLSWSDELLSGSGLDDAALARGRPVFDQMRTELMGGQYLDMLEQARPGSPADAADRARQVIRYKSAKYTIEHPLLLGGALAGASAQLLASYSAFGLPLGEAFQLRDDVLGVFGDPEQTGKPAGDDLREGKRTVLIAFAMQKASSTQQALMRRHLGDPRLDAGSVETLREVIVDTGALDEVERLVESLVAEAAAALDTSSVAEPARGVLTQLITAATARQT